MHIFEMLQSNGDLQLINIDNLQFVYLKYLIRQISIVTNVSYYHGGVEIRSIYRSINKKLNNLSTKP